MNSSAPTGTRTCLKPSAAQQIKTLIAARDQATAENAVKALWDCLDKPRTLIKGGASDITQSFFRVGNTVLKVCAQSFTGDVVYNVAKHAVRCFKPELTVSITPATEGELLDVLEDVKGSQRLLVREFLRIVRDEPAKPMEIKIVNANEFQKDTVLSIKRGDDGKMSGATAMKV